MIFLSQKTLVSQCQTTVHRKAYFGRCYHFPLQLMALLDQMFKLIFQELQSNDCAQLLLFKVRDLSLLVQIIEW